VSTTSMASRTSSSLRGSVVATSVGVALTGTRESVISAPRQMSDPHLPSPQVGRDCAAPIGQWI